MVMEELGIKDVKVDSEINRKILDLYENLPIERITYVRYKKYILAGMLQTSDAFSDLQFTFFRDLSCLEDKFT